jgi:hypothetical protein
MAPTVEAGVAAAPLLEVVTADKVYCTWKDAPRMLRAEPPFAPLQIRCPLYVHLAADPFLVGGMERYGPFAAALADATLNKCLSAAALQCIGLRTLSHRIAPHRTPAVS